MASADQGGRRLVSITYVGGDCDDPPVDDRVHAQRLRAQLLSGPRAASVDAVVGRLLAVQAQDPRGFRLSVRARSAGLAASDVEASLAAGETVVSWLNRGTLHLVRRDDYAFLQLLTTPQLTTGNARRLRQEGVTPAQADKGVAAITEAVRHGPRTRDELREVVASADCPVAGQALVHVLLLASIRGHVVRGPMRQGSQAFVGVEEWLGPQPSLDRDTALAELARRYLAGHGPADDRDLAQWSGITLGDARRGLSGVRNKASAKPDLPPPMLLGPFDPVLLGWSNRSRIVGDHRQLVTTNGIFRPFVMVDGRAVATWGYRGGSVHLTPLEGELPDLSDEVCDVERFLSS